MDLGEEVIEVKLILGDTLLETLSFTLVIELLCTLDEGDDITHAEDTVSHTLGVEDIQSVHLLAHPDELNRLVDDGTDREGSPTTGIPIELGEDDPIEV